MLLLRLLWRWLLLSLLWLWLRLRLLLSWLRLLWLFLRLLMLLCLRLLPLGDARRVVGGFLKRGLAPSFLPLLPRRVVALLTGGAAEDVDVALAV